MFKGIISAIKEHYYRESPRELNVGEQTAVILAYLGPDRLPKFTLDTYFLTSFNLIVSRVALRTLILSQNLEILTQNSFNEPFPYQSTF